MKFLKFLFYLALLIGGFFLGTSWQNKTTPPDTTPQVASDVDENPRHLGRRDLSKNYNAPPMPPGLNEDEKATIRLFENSAPSVAYITTSPYPDRISGPAT